MGSIFLGGFVLWELLITCQCVPVILGTCNEVYKIVGGKCVDKRGISKYVTCSLRLARSLFFAVGGSVGVAKRTKEKWKGCHLGYDTRGRI